MSPHSHHASQYVPQLACTHCQQRKIKCDKRNPCSACTKLGIACQAVRRTRLPRGRSGKQSKNNDILIDRVKRLEELVTSITVSVDGCQSISHGPELDGLIASGFWSNLSEAVTGVKEVLAQRDELGSASSEGDFTSQIPWTSLGTTESPIKPESVANVDYFTLYKERFHPLFRVLHWPTVLCTLQEVVDDAAESKNITALREAVMFGASCTILLGEQQDRDDVIAYQRARAETALMAAGLLTTKDLQVLQAFLIYLAALRSCQGNALQWSLVALAVRIAQGMKLQRRGGISLWMWWSIGILDLQAAFDRGSEPLLKPSDLDKFPDEDEIVSKFQSTEPHLFTETSTALVTLRAMHCQLKILHERSSLSQIQRLSQLRTRQTRILEDFQAYVEDMRAAPADDRAPPKLREFALAIGHESTLAMRLLIHRPLAETGNMGIDVGDDIDVLGAATELLESAVFKTSADFRQWSWFRWPKWYALAIVLAELVARPLPWNATCEHSWAVAQHSFVSYAGIVADGETGMLWWPIANLMLRARTKLIADNTGREIDDKLFEQVVQETLGSECEATKYSQPSDWNDNPWEGLVHDYWSDDVLREEPNWEQWLQMECMS